MASTPLQVEDQTDEEFFDKLVDDDDGAGQSHSKPEEMARVPSNIGLGDVEDYGRASEEDCSKDNKYVESSEASKDGASFTEAHSEGLSEEGGGGAKGTNVKEAKWSDFSVDYQQFGQVGFESGSFIGSADGSFVIPPTGSEHRSSIIESTAKNLSSFTGSGEQQDPQLYSSVSEHSANLREMQNWENLYPGWKYDPNAGQWYRLDGYSATENTESDDFSVTRESSHEGDEAKVQNAFDGSVTERADALYRQQTSHSVLETISDASIVSNSWNQVSQGSIEYPPNMVFDPQYPEWYYDTVTQQWYTLESYNHALHDASSSTQVQQSSNVNTSAGSTIADGYVSHGSDEQSEKYLLQEHSSQASHRSASASGFGQQSMWQEQNTQGHWNASGSVYNLQSMWQQLPSQESHREAFVNGDFAIYSTNQLTGGFRGSMVHAGSQPVKQVRSNSLEHTLEHISGNSNLYPFQDYVPLESTHHYNQPHMEQSLAARLSNSNYGTKSSINYTEQSFQVANPLQSQFSYIPNEGRSSAGRPPHTLVSFGFGGKIILMKDFSSLSTTFVSESHGTAGGVISIHSLMDVVMAKTNSFSGFSGGLFDYFHSLCQQSFPGPLVGGNAASKDVNKWMDDRIMSSESSSMDSESGEFLRLLLSLLKILCQHYGKLRSPYGVDSSLEGSDGPESLVSKLFASAKRNDAPFGGFGSSKHCMKNLPSDGQMRATAIKFQTLLVSGKRMEALQCAQQGQLWGPALILAAQLGEQFYVDTVKQMAKQQFISGSPLRTLCLLIAGQPADVFSDDNSSSGLSSAISGPHQSSGVLPNSMLDDWKENLAIITSNRTKDDEVVIIHLGDCLWKVRGEVTAAHTCYLVSEANFESYSDSTRLCLIGADHWKNPRTYACPDAIQRTEIYEYSRVIGNSQFVLLPFQPYKLVYAYMLAEVGKVSDSLRYCQASVKLLKNSGRSPEVEMWRTLFLSLEERLRTHQQGGYGTNLTPTKLVGKLFSSIDRSIHRMIGTPPLPPIPHNSGEVSTSQSTMAITSLMPSASVEDVSDWAGDGSSKAVHNRSISEPDFGRSPKQSSSKSTRSHGQGNTAVSVRPSHFGRFGFQLLQKTIGWMPWPRHDRQAKLGESNKFYYDEKLKRWVEEGTEPKGEETSLPPPPSGASFPNGISDYNINNTLMSTDLTTTDAGQETKLNASSEPGFGFPPMPPSQNQFSVRSRMGVRSRYVDTFNKGGGRSVTSSFQSPSTPSVKPFAVAKFFVPSAPTEDQTNDATRTSINENTITQEPSTSAGQESIFSPASTLSSSSLQRFPSMNNVVSPGSFPGENGSLSRTRAASWSGAYTDISNAKADAMEHSFVASGLASTFAHIRTSSSSSLQLHGGGSDDLHEVKL